MVIEFNHLVPGKKILLSIVSFEMHDLVFALPISTDYF